MSQHVPSSQSSNGDIVFCKASFAKNEIYEYLESNGYMAHEQEAYEKISSEIKKITLADVETLPTKPIIPPDDPTILYEEVNLSDTSQIVVKTSRKEGLECFQAFWVKSETTASDNKIKRLCMKIHYFDATELYPVGSLQDLRFRALQSRTNFIKKGLPSSLYVPPTLDDDTPAVRAAMLNVAPKRAFFCKESSFEDKTRHAVTAVLFYDFNTENEVLSRDDEASYFCFSKVAYSRSVGLDDTTVCDRVNCLLKDPTVTFDLERSRQALDNAHLKTPVESDGNPNENIITVESATVVAIATFVDRQLNLRDLPCRKYPDIKGIPENEFPKSSFESFKKDANGDDVLLWYHPTTSFVFPFAEYERLAKLKISQHPYLSQFAFYYKFVLSNPDPVYEGVKWATKGVVDPTQLSHSEIINLYCKVIGVQCGDIVSTTVTQDDFTSVIDESEQMKIRKPAQNYLSLIWQRFLRLLVKGGDYEHQGIGDTLKYILHGVASVEDFHRAILDIVSKKDYIKEIEGKKTTLLKKLLLEKDLKDIAAQPLPSRAVVKATDGRKLTLSVDQIEEEFSLEWPQSSQWSPPPVGLSIPINLFFNTGLHRYQVSLFFKGGLYDDSGRAVELVKTVRIALYQNFSEDDLLKVASYKKSVCEGAPSTSETYRSKGTTNYSCPLTTSEYSNPRNTSSSAASAAPLLPFYPSDDVCVRSSSSTTEKTHAIESQNSQNGADYQTAKKQTVCRHYKMGKCAYGDKCYKLHEGTDQVQSHSPGTTSPPHSHNTLAAKEETPSQAHSPERKTRLYYVLPPPEERLKRWLFDHGFGAYHKDITEKLDILSLGDLANAITNSKSFSRPLGTNSKASPVVSDTSKSITSIIQNPNEMAKLTNLISLTTVEYIYTLNKEAHQQFIRVVEDDSTLRAKEFVKSRKSSDPPSEALAHTAGTDDSDLRSSPKAFEMINKNDRLIRLSTLSDGGDAKKGNGRGILDYVGKALEKCVTENKLVLFILPTGSRFEQKDFLKAMEGKGESVEELMNGLGFDYRYLVIDSHYIWDILCSVGHMGNSESMSLLFVPQANTASVHASMEEHLSTRGVDEYTIAHSQTLRFSTLPVLIPTFPTFEPPPFIGGDFYFELPQDSFDKQFGPSASLSVFPSDARENSRAQCVSRPGGALPVAENQWNFIPRPSLKGPPNSDTPPNSGVLSDSLGCRPLNKLRDVLVAGLASPVAMLITAGENGFGSRSTRLFDVLALDTHTFPTLIEERLFKIAEEH